MKILIAGELNVDLILQNYSAFPSLGREVLVDDASLTLGSASAICAAGLRKLGNAVVFAGKLGCDSWGDLCLDSLEKLGIDCSSIVRDPEIKTGVTVSITSARDRALITFLGSIATLQARDISEQAMARCQHLHVSSYFLQQALRPGVRWLLSTAHRLGLRTSLDPGFDPSETWSLDLIETLTEVDVFLPNAVELEGVTGTANRFEALRKLQNGRTVTVAKLGAEGCMALAADGKVISVPAFPVVPVDTTGAGDSFNAGFLHAWLRGKDLQESMIFAAGCGALSTIGLGGTANQATETEVAAFIEAHRETRVRGA